MAIMPEIQDDTSNAEIKISALTFSDNAKWTYNEPQSIENFKWKDAKAQAGTDLSCAYDELSKWLSKKSNGGKMPDLGGVAPIIILMTDGLPTSPDWEDHLAKLKKKGWFKVALKYALAIGIDTDEAMDVLNKFTGNPETVLKIYNAETLRKAIKVIAVTASKVKSQHGSTGIGSSAKDQTNNELAQKEIKKNLEEIESDEW